MEVKIEGFELQNLGCKTLTGSHYWKTWVEAITGSLNPGQILAITESHCWKPLLEYLENDFENGQMEVKTGFFFASAPWERAL